MAQFNHGSVQVQEGSKEHLVNLQYTQQSMENMICNQHESFDIIRSNQDEVSPHRLQNFKNKRKKQGLSINQQRSLKQPQKLTQPEYGLGLDLRYNSLV